MRLVGSLILCLACLVVCAPPALAEQITVSDSVSIASPASAQWGSLAVDAFNPSLGTLNQVDVLFTATLNGHSTFQNTTPWAGTFTRGLASSGVLKYLSATLNINAYADAGSYDVPVDAFGTSTIVFPETLDTANWSTTDPGRLAAFVGAGSLTLTYGNGLNHSGAISSPDGNITGNIISWSGVTDLEVDVTYRFTSSGGSDSAPEPSTFALLAAGAVGLFLVRRRRQGRA